MLYPEFMRTLGKRYTDRLSTRKSRWKQAAREAWSMRSMANGGILGAPTAP